MNSDGHIVSSFDRDLEALQAQLVRMCGMVETALGDSATALETRDLDLANRVIETDRAIDALDDQINTQAAAVIALRAPTASDLRLVLAVMRTAHSLERVGDYAKNVAKRTKVLAQIPELPGISGTIRRMAKLVAVMLEQAMRAMVRRDAVLAETVRQSDVDIDQMYNNLFRSLLTHMLESPSNITAAMHLHFIAKNIERAGDHATGIAEQAIYLATGHFPHDERPKVDPTSDASGSTPEASPS
ncbi:MAG: phosphate signaling complex protein PhoU [Paracoccaceae bacterium]